MSIARTCGETYIFGVRGAFRHYNSGDKVLSILRFLIVILVSRFALEQPSAEIVRVECTNVW